VAATLKQLGAVTQSSAIVDLGCGTGMSSEALRGHGFRGPITGVDISAASLDIAKGKPGLYSALHQGNLDRGLPFLEDDEFDVAISVGVLSYVENFDHFLSGAARTCKPGGLICVTHRAELWDRDDRGVRTAAVALEEARVWECVHVGEPEAYMPNNPDPIEAAKTIRVLCWSVLPR
jgi:predicted TPR repeat methyltransferase